VSLARVLAQGEGVVPIPGTTRRTYLHDNIDAVNVRLSADDLRMLDEVFPKGVAAGDQHPDMSTVVDFCLLAT
jgi:aryl-alcohol dehydrogenase-like predicted oxidoreductase